MPNIGVLLKSEIARLSKKAVKAHVQPLQAASAAQRRHIAAMKRQITALEREVAQLRRDKTRNAAAGARQAETEGADASPLRFQARGLRSLRTRLGLGAEDFGRLIGVSGQSIYNWEAEKTTPRRAQLEALSALRSMGKREATRRLEEQKGA